MKESSDTIGNRTSDLLAWGQCLYELCHRVPPCWTLTASINWQTNSVGCSPSWEAHSSSVRQETHEGGKVVSPTCRPPLPPQEIFPVLISDRSRVDRRAILWLEELCQWKIPVTLSGIEPTTFQLVAQCLNRLRHQKQLKICTMHIFFQILSYHLASFRHCTAVTA